MEYPVANELVVRLSRVTALPVLDCARLLATMSPEEQQRGVAAAESDELLTDPIENDPKLGPIVTSVMEEVAERVQKEHDSRVAKLERTLPAVAKVARGGRGLCHHIWHDTKERLKEEYGIEWKSPAEMNPWILFD